MSLQNSQRSFDFLADVVRAIESLMVCHLLLSIKMCHLIFCEKDLPVDRGLLYHTFYNNY